MNRLASALSLALVFSVAACSDDAKPSVDALGGVDGGGTDGGGSGDGAAPGTCTGSFAGATQAQLAGAISMSSGPKSCAADVAAVCTGNIASVAGACGLSCLGMPAEMATTCVSTCITTKLATNNLTLSAACNGCYAATVVCTQTMCLNDCAADPSAAKCTQCQIDKGCRSSFATCSGLPTGMAPGDGGAASEAGAGDAGVADSAAGDTAAASDVAASSDTSTD
jgi:hypothetical protein